MPTGYFISCGGCKLYGPSYYSQPAQRARMNGAFQPGSQAEMWPMKVRVIPWEYKSA